MSQIQHAAYYTTNQRMLEALPPSPPVGPSPFYAWLNAQYSIISKTSIRSHLRRILPKFSTHTRIVEEPARNIWGYVHRSFDVVIANSNSPGQPYPLLLRTTPLGQANLTLTCLYWFTNCDWMLRFFCPDDPSVDEFGRCVYGIACSLILSIDSRHINKNTTLPAWVCPSSVKALQTGQLEAAIDDREHEEKSNRRCARTDGSPVPWMFNVTLDVETTWQFGVDGWFLVKVSSAGVSSLAWCLSNFGSI